MFFIDSDKITYVDVITDCLIKLSKMTKIQANKQKQTRCIKKKKNPVTQRTINNVWCTLGKGLCSSFRFTLAYFVLLLSLYESSSQAFGWCVQWFSQTTLECVPQEHLHVGNGGHGWLVELDCRQPVQRDPLAWCTHLDSEPEVGFLHPGSDSPQETLERYQIYWKVNVHWFLYIKDMNIFVYLYKYMYIYKYFSIEQIKLLIFGYDLQPMVFKPCFIELRDPPEVPQVSRAMRWHRPWEGRLLCSGDLELLLSVYTGAVRRLGWKSSLAQIFKTTDLKCHSAVSYQPLLPRRYQWKLSCWNGWRNDPLLALDLLLAVILFLCDPLCCFLLVTVQVLSTAETSATPQTALWGDFIWRFCKSTILLYAKCF